MKLKSRKQSFSLKLCKFKASFMSYRVVSLKDERKFLQNILQSSKICPIACNRAYCYSSTSVGSPRVSIIPCQGIENFSKLNYPITSLYHQFLDVHALSNHLNSYLSISLFFLLSTSAQQS